MEVRLRTVADALLEGLQVIDREWRYLYLNPAAVAHARQAPEALIGRTMMACYPGIEHTEMFAALRETMQSGEARVLTNAFTYPDGEVGHFELHIEPVPDGIAVLSLDISDRVAQEAELARLAEREALTEKMQAVSLLAGGVAHDLNNMLHLVLGTADLLAQQLDDPTAREHLGVLTEAATKASEVARRLSDLGSVRAVAPVDLAALARSVCELLARSLAPDVALVFVEPSDALPPTLADRTAVERALVNLITNARDAVEGTGTVTVELEAVTLDPEDVDMLPGAKAGCYLLLSVSDDGVGMDEETRRRAVEPFFTTKGEQGTGFGLANTYATMREAGGHLWLYSEPGLGTTVKLYFPVAAQRAGPAVLPPPLPGGHILVVDDEARLRRMMAESLTRAGYAVETAGTAHAALRAVRERPPAAVICDLVLPDVRGPELVEQIHRLAPATRVLWVSGYSRSATAETLVLAPGTDFLGKPFSGRMLCEKVAELLG